MKRKIGFLLALLVLQAGLLLLYKQIEDRRVGKRRVRGPLSIAAPLALEGSQAPLAVRRRDGKDVHLRALKRPLLLHFWATWCPPCRAELPGLLALSNERQIDLLAVALDEKEDEVDRFWEDGRPSNVILGDRVQARIVFGVQTLPVTFLVNPGGQLRLRFDGARDWTDAHFLRSWIPKMEAP